jgi:hypothetical protein
MDLVHLHFDQGWTPGGHGLLGGGATLLSSHAKASSTGDERHSERQSDRERPTA